MRPKKITRDRTKLPKKTTRPSVTPTHTGAKTEVSPETLAKMVEEFNAQEHVVAMRDRYAATGNVLPPRAPQKPTVEQTLARLQDAVITMGKAVEKMLEKVKGLKS